jgi:hypothetical protein
MTLDRNVLAPIFSLSTIKMAAQIPLSQMLELVQRSLQPYYGSNQHSIIEEPCEGGEETETTVNALDFILRAISETYVERYGTIEDITGALQAVNAEEISYPKPDICISAIMSRYGGARRKNSKSRKTTRKLKRKQ